MTKNAEYFRDVLKGAMPVLAERFQISSLALFGSYVRGSNRPDSDLDLLVEFSKTPSLFRYVEAEDYLSDLLGVRVDLVMRRALKPRIQANVELVEV